MLSQKLLNMLIYRLENILNLVKVEKSGTKLWSILKSMTQNRQITEKDLFICEHLIYNKSSMKDWWVKIDCLINGRGIIGENDIGPQSHTTHEKQFQED